MEWGCYMLFAFVFIILASGCQSEVRICSLYFVTARHEPTRDTLATQTTSTVPPCKHLSLNDAVLALGVRLLQQVAPANASSAGTFISPLSSYMALAMALNGAGKGFSAQMHGL